MAEFIRIGTGPHTWEALAASWRSETEALEEYWDEIEQLQADILRPLSDRNDPKAGVYAVFEDGRYRSICQLNTTGLPGYPKPVMRMRHLTFAPSIDLSGSNVDPYVDALLETFWQVIMLCRAEGPMRAAYMKFHLPSPNDRHFFTIAGNSFVNHKLFESIAPKGTWLYITVESEDEK